MATTNLGRIGFVLKGVWTAGTYKYLDIVRYQSSMYACQVATTTNDPSNATDWMLLNSDLIAGIQSGETTNMNGLIKGNGSTVSAATAGADYALPTGSISNLKGGNATTLFGAIPYQSNTDTTTLLAPNTTTTKKALTQVGNGTNGAAPTWSSLISSTAALLKGDGSGGAVAIVSGTDIKTVNGNTLLGSGDISITASGINSGGSTNMTGLIKGNGSTVSAATAGTDYAGISTANVFTSNQQIGNVVFKAKTANRIIIDDISYPSGGTTSEQILCIGANIAPSATGAYYSIGISPGNYTYNCLGSVTTGYENIAIGTQTLNGITTGYRNTAVGTGAYSSGNYINSSCFGYGSAVTGDNQVQLGNASTTTYVYGTVQNRSDLRDKTDVQDTQLGLDFINALRPVDYRWDMREDYKPLMPEMIQYPDNATGEEKIAIDVQNKVAKDEWLESVKLSNITRDGTKKRSRLHHGLIAQEVKAVIDTIGIDFGGFQDHSLKGGDDVLSLGYDEFIAPLIKAVQELTAENKAIKEHLGL